MEASTPQARYTCALEDVYKRQVQGSGTYVAERTDATYIPRVDTFVDDMCRRGFEGSTRMIATRWVDATEEISTHLSVPVGEQVLFVRRLRLADHEVIGFERSYFVKAAASSILDAMMAVSYTHLDVAVLVLRLDVLHV